MLKILSAGIQKIEYLDEFLQEEMALYSDPKRIEAVAGWGFKPTANEARELARKLQVPYIALEDGFLRSLDLGVKGAKPLSISVDPVGCYYAADRPSLIEQTIAEICHHPDSNPLNDPDTARMVRQSISAIVAGNLSKYNCQPDADLLLAGAGDQDGRLQVLRDFMACTDKILLLDQCLGDASLTQGLAPDNAAEMMLRRAGEEYPKAKIFLKVHPDVLSGKRQSLLYPALQGRSDIQVLDCDVSVMSLLKAKPVVFTVSSQSGFEALLCGCRVYCFGMPFYAGYGLTADAQPCPRRNVLRGVSVEMLFYAAYIKLCRYINPIRGNRCSVSEVIDLLSMQKSINDQNRGGAVVYGVKRWKYPILRAYLQCTDGSGVYFTKSRHKALALSQRLGSTLVQWASKKDADLEAQAQRLGIKTLNVEDGFLRSIGLGCEHTYPFSLVFDSEGIYYSPRQSSGLEQILNHFADLSPQSRSDLAERGAALRQQILKANLTKYNVGTDSQSELASLREQLQQARSRGREIILVPGQVENDASVLEAGGAITSNQALLEAVRLDFPEAFVIYKPHPDVLALNRPGLRHSSDLPCDFVVRDAAITLLFTLIDRLCTLTSLSGFEALLRDLKVSVYGRPFYAGWGLTADHCEFPGRRARLSVDELCAGVYILYPRYFDWCSGTFMTPEDCVWRLKHPGKMPEVQLIVRLARGFYALRRTVYRQFDKELRNDKK